MDKHISEDTVSFANQVFTLTIDANEVYSLGKVLTEAFSHSDTDPSEFVPALKVLTRQLSELQKNISDLNEKANKLWAD